MRSRPQLPRTMLGILSLNWELPPASLSSRMAVPARVHSPFDASVDPTETSQPIIRRPDGRPGSQQLVDLPGESLVEYLGVIVQWANQRRTPVVSSLTRGRGTRPFRTANLHRPVVHFPASTIRGSWDRGIIASVGPAAVLPGPGSATRSGVMPDGLTVLKGLPCSLQMHEVVPSSWKGWNPMLLSLPRLAGTAGTSDLGRWRLRHVNHGRRADTSRLSRVSARGAPGRVLRIRDALSDAEPAIRTGTVWNRSDLVASCADREDIESG
jgi:hypothetical protein